MRTTDSSPNTGKLHIVLLSEEDIQRLNLQSVDDQLQVPKTAEDLAIHLEKERHRDSYAAWEKRCMLNILVHTYQAVLRHKGTVV